MYNVIIVDDEPMIREGLRTLIPWEEYGFNVMGIAKNGRDGLEKYQQYAPDLMIVDIRMPEVDGITLIETIRKKNKSVHFIILSGYADFEYAKRALGCQCDGYLLKPLDEDEFIVYLKEVHRKLQNEKKLTILMESEGLKRKEDFIERYLINNNSHSDIDLEELCQSYDLHAASYQVVLLATEDDMELDTEIRNIINKENNGFMFDTNSYKGVLFKENFSISTGQSQLLEKIKEYKIYAAVGEIVDCPENIHISYNTAQQLLENKYFYQEGVLLTCKDMRSNNRHEGLSESDFSVDSYVERLYYSIEIVSYEACEKIVNELAEYMINGNFSEQKIKKNFTKIYTNTLNKILLANENMQSVLSPMNSIAGELYEIKNLPSLVEFVLNELLKVINSLDNGQTDVSLKKMIDLIHKEYDQNLRLDTLATVFNYNSAYLGKLFKNHTGEYFNTYLDKVRIEKGKQLLVKGYKVYEVAERIGYANVDYFHRKFKKYVGVSPSSFRKEM